MLLDGPRQDDLFEIFPFVDQIGDRILVRDANDLLFDDRAGVQFGSDIVAGRPDDLYAAFESRMIRFRLDIAQKLIFILKMVIKRLAVKTALTCYIGYGYFIKGFLLAEFFQ